MTSEYWKAVEEAYTEASRLPPDARMGYLSSTYADRPDIFREVQSLLDHQCLAQNIDRSVIMIAAAELLQDEDNVIGEIVGGRYLIRSCIGSGAMAEVYLADHIALKTPFALKRPLPAFRDDPSYRSRFLEEARRAVQLKHDNVTRVHDVLSEGKDIFVVMEHVEGKTLRDHMTTLARPLTVAEFLPIATQCAAALAAAHEKRIVHLDVKPENIMLTPAGQVKICDFGVARRLSSGQPNETTISSKSDWTLAGTPSYMAPEVILSHQFDERADLFSLGTVFYEMLSEHNPFLADTTVTTTARVVSEDPAPLSSLNAQAGSQLERIVMRLLSKDPDERYQKATDVVRDLEAVQRSHRPLRSIVDDFRQWIIESHPLRFAVFVLAVFVAAVPGMYVFRNYMQSVVPLPERKVFVVLPFRVIGDTPSRAIWDGLTETVTAKLNDLAPSPQLQVMSVAEVWARAVKTPSDARKQFGANLALDGSSYLAGNEYQIVLSLVETRTMSQVRSRTFSVGRDDALMLQSRVNQEVAALLELELGPHERTAMADQGTGHPAAYDLYLKGVGYLANREPEFLEKAVQSFQQALIYDVNFSRAYAGLGQAFLRRFQTEKDVPLIERAEENCERAVNLDPNFAAGHVCRGAVFQARGKYQDAVEEFERAIAIDRKSDEAYRGLASAHSGLSNLEAAEGAFRRAIEVKPDYWDNYVRLAAFYVSDRPQYEEAIRLYRQAIAKNPDNPVPYMSLGGAFIGSGQYREAVEACRKSVEVQPTSAGYINLGVAHSALRQFSEAAVAFERARELQPRYYKILGHLARTYYWTSRRAEALELYKQAIDLAENVELRAHPNNAAVHIMVARYYAMLGRRDEAMAHVQIALKDKPKDHHYETIAAVVHNQFGDRTAALSYLAQAIAGGYPLAEIDAEIELDNLREDPRYRALIAGRSAKGEDRGKN